MTPRKVNIHWVWLTYAGNGSMAAACPELRPWWGKTLLTMKADPRVSEITESTISDTPVTMSRNRAVLQARAVKADILVMIDSDNIPDTRLGKDSNAKPFWDSSFEFLYNHYDRGPTAVLAPYCGPPPHECVYMFHWDSKRNSNPNVDMSLEMYSRHEAAQRAGFEPVAAGPTGVSMWDMRLFDLTDPRLQYEDLLRRGVNPKDAVKLVDPWFDYEWVDVFHSDKASTEDVFFSRNALLVIHEKLGYHPLYANWDAWAGHQKGLLVDKPQLMTVEHVGEVFREAVNSKRHEGESLRHITMPDWLRARLMGQVEKSNGQSETSETSHQVPSLPR